MLLLMVVPQNLIGQEKAVKAENPAELHGKLIRKDAIHRVEKVTDGKILLKEYYYETGILTGQYYFLDKTLQTQDGPFWEFTDDGKKRLEGHFSKNEQAGNWTEFFENGQPKETYSFKNGKKEGESLKYDEAGRVVLRRFYKNGLRHGVSTEIDSLGNFIATKIWKNDSLVSSIRNGVAQKLPLDETMPQYPGGEGELMIFIAKSIKYPYMAREKGISGRAFGSFWIEKDGSVSEIKVTHGLCDKIGEEVKRVLSSMPTWTPGTKNGKPVRVQMGLPVMFKLE